MLVTAHSLFLPWCFQKSHFHIAIKNCLKKSWKNVLHSSSKRKTQIGELALMIKKTGTSCAL